MASPSTNRTGFSLLIAALLVCIAAPGDSQAQYFRFGKNKVQYQDLEWSYIQSTHFDIFYYNDAYDLAVFTARAAEDAYLQISSLFRYRLSERIPLIVYKSHNDFVVTNAVDLPIYSEGIGGVTELFKNRVAIPFMGDLRDYRRVLHHELVHAVLNDMFYGGSIQSILQNNLRLRIPLWFNEGLAEYSALGWDTNSDMYVRDAILTDDLPPIQYLSGYYAYRGGQSVWDFVATQYGKDKINEILQRLRMSRSIEESFKHSTGLSLDELSERWHQSLREVHYPELAARENLDQAARILISREDGHMNTSPALSPRGDLLAFVSTRGSFFDVYLASVSEGTVLKKLINGQDNSDFESLRILTPGLSWSPDGRQIAIAVKSKHTEAIAVVDVASGEVQHYRTPDVDQIFSVAWNPRGHQIAFSGTQNGRSDIYLLDIGTSNLVRLTDDPYSDHEPAWRPDGRTIVFHSDRGDQVHTSAGRYSNAFDHDFSRYDLYMIDVDANDPEASGGIQRLTRGDRWDNLSARFGSDPNLLLFVSDRNGIYNLYEKHLLTGAERPLTDVVRGVMQVALSGDGNRAAIVSLRKGVPSIYILNDPFNRTLENDALAPNVWAQRVHYDSTHQAPALAVSSASVRQNNPFVRSAQEDGNLMRWNDRLAQRREIEQILAESDPNRTESGSAIDHQTTDSTAYGSVRVDFRTYVFDEPHEETTRNTEDRFEIHDPFNPPDNLNEDGSFREKKYRLRFSPDIVYGTAGYDVLYGVQGVTQMLFSDMLGDHQIFVATNLLIDLRNSDYVITYAYLPRRIDWSISSYHISRLLPDFNRFTYYRYRQYGTSIAASYPLDKFRRIDAEAYVLGVSQTDIGEPERPTATRLMLYPSLSYTLDFTSPGRVAPVGGRRLAFNISGSPVSFRGGTSEFLTFLGDARFYTSFGGGSYSFAFRLSGGTSIGPGQQLFFSSGTQNWINRRFDDENGFPIDEVSDFIFARPVLPMRGYDINARNGSNFALANIEFRYPIVAALLPGPLPFLPLYNLHGTAFVDAGGIWGGRGDDARFRLLSTGEDGNKRLDDAMIGIGLGIRTILLGFPIRVDYAWPHDGQSFGSRRLYLSVGLDF